ncbi:hypothetical protein PRZ48_008444 [Zasmidium cellare]|uniref:Heterokaryon incompatibility domain-containing protein n=1 Tax=Zasmidium cellare TaxID=395010 RepID=A0ABR0EFH9_ZASCE|nr:hypothetical protein PRZ48_008444 [Zasmidium cellare]
MSGTFGLGPPPAVDESSRSIEQYISETVHLITWAINNRYLGSDSGTTKANSHPVWDRVADDFNAEPEYLAAAVARDLSQAFPLNLSDDGFKTYVIGRDRVQEMFRRLVDAYPGYQIKAKDISTTVHEKARWAISYVTMETYDLPPGVVRHSLGVFEWKRIGGKWLLTKVLVWVDALCINQADLDERSRQVSLMKQIFSRAESVYIWLGMAPGRPVARALDEGPDSGDLRWMVSLNRETRENEPFVGLSTQDLDYLLSWKDHAWWKRKWVLQEIAVARHPPLVLFDDFVFDGWAFFRAWPMELVFSRQWDVRADDIDVHVVGTQKSWKAFMSAEHSMRVPWKLRSWWEYYQVSLGGGRPLGELLRLAAASLASHELDHVFGLIGLATPFHRAAIPINYKKAPKELFMDVSRLLWSRETNPTQHAILKDSEDSSFDVLAFQWERYRSPSWVCNFSQPTTYDRIDYQMWLYLDDQQTAERQNYIQDEPGSPSYAKTEAGVTSCAHSC